MNRAKRTAYMARLRQSLVDEFLDSGGELTAAEEYATVELTRFYVARWPGKLLRMVVRGG